MPYTIVLTSQYGFEAMERLTPSSNPQQKIIRLAYVEKNASKMKFTIYFYHKEQLLPRTHN